MASTRYFRYFVLLILVLLSSCASNSLVEHASPEWPANIPARAIYEAYYSSDLINQQSQSQPDYLTWVIRFYNGWIYEPQGWLAMTSSALEHTANATQREQLERDMHWLGKHISAEWAKDNRSRKINTSHMLTWADALIVAVRDNEPVKLTTKIKADVLLLLAGELASDAVSLERYFDFTPAPLVVENTDFQDPFEF